MFGMRGPSVLELAVEKLVREVMRHESGGESHAKAMDSLVKLHKMMIEERSSRVSKDTLILAGANLLGILMIIRHEHVNIIMSKAIGLLLRPR